MADAGLVEVASLPGEQAVTSHSPGTSPGAAVFTPYHLKPNGRFSDGIPVTAQHFVYSTTRSLTPKLISGNVFFYFTTN